MRDVAIIGAGMSPFGRWPEKGIKDLVREAVQDALKDVNIDKKEVEAAYVGSAAVGLMTGQEQIRAQVTLSAMGIDTIPMYNIENACGSSSTALNLAWIGVASGQYDVALVVGFEKLYDENRMKSYAALGTAVDIEMVDKSMEEYRKELGVEESVFSEESGTSKSVFMDMYAFYTKNYMKTTDLTQKHFAQLAVKGHRNGVHNPNAHYQKEVTIEEVLNSGVVSFPLTRMMCSPVSDGAAAAIICSKDKAAQFTAKPIWIEASAVGSGRITSDLEDTLIKRTAARCYELAGIGPEDVDVVEVHDATSPSEIIQLIETGLCPAEEAVQWIEDGHLEITGKLPSNPSGGLTTKGHPIGATGLGQIHEILNQLRNTAGKRQVNEPKIGMTVNGGGILGLDGAASAFHILKR